MPFTHRASSSLPQIASPTRNIGANALQIPPIKSPTLATILTAFFTKVPSVFLINPKPRPVVLPVYVAVFVSPISFALATSVFSFQDLKVSANPPIISVYVFPFHVASLSTSFILEYSFSFSPTVSSEK